MSHVFLRSRLRPKHHATLVVVAALMCATGNLSAQMPPPPVEDEDIRGPKPLIVIPEPEKPNYPLWFGLAGGAIVLALGGYLWNRHRRRQILKTPRKIALESLAKLEATRESLTAETFANQAALTVRQYISERFGINAPRRSTEEFLRELATENDSPLIPESDHLRDFLKSCDLAKFAASNLDSAQRGELIEAARTFVHVTAARTAEHKPEAAKP